ncbi:MAG: FecCD family ABC transporter permease [bacterium]
MKPRGYAILAGVLVIAALVRVSIGPIASSHGVQLALAIPSGEILGLRAMSVLSAAMVGATLGLSGLALQTLLRNPLASPFVLGISSGAGFGVACVLVVGYLVAGPAPESGATSGFLSAWATEAVGAVIGAALALTIVARFGRSGDGHDPTTLVLAGVILGSIFSAGTVLLEQLVPHGLRGDLLSWMAGRLPEIPDARSLATLAVAVTLGWIMLASSAGALDVSMLSEDEARSSGVVLATLRSRLFWIGGILAGLAVAYAGPIGFVGLVGPHLARRLLGPHHSALVPGSALAGAALLVAADAVRQAIDLGSGRLPVGVLTALAGGPAFLWLLRRGAFR